MNKGAQGHRFEELNYRKLNPGEALVICPNCGEDNSENFRYCGMCGTLLEAPRPISVQKAIVAAEAVRKGVGVAAEPRRTPATETPGTATPKPAPPTGGPSLLGLDQPSSPADQTLPSMDSLRDRSFSGLDSFFEPEEPRNGGLRVFLLLILLAAIGAAGWWAWSNYMGAIGTRGRQSPNANPSPNATANTPANPPSAPESSSSTTPAPAPATPTSETPQPAAVATAQNPAPPSNAKPTETKPAQGAPSETKEATAPKPAPPQKVARTETKPTPAAAPPAPAAEDNGDTAFRKGEAYLYGRGVPENCAEAIRYLKDASAQRNAKARSTFGTMYATGHCVPRDFPTSYSWFAQALRVDPNNQILEKDLTAVWNQMTPPERQMATRLSQ